jgi:hypothetical protein
MSELALFLVRIGFVAVLWIFILSLLSVFVPTSTVAG